MKYPETIAPPENLPGTNKKSARRWRMKAVGAALDFAIEFLPAFSKVISPMAFALFLRIGSPGEHGILLYERRFRCTRESATGLAFLTIIPQKPR